MSDRKYPDIQQTLWKPTRNNRKAPHCTLYEKVCAYRCWGAGWKRYKSVRQRHPEGFLYLMGLQISLFNSVSLSMKRQKRPCHVMQTG